MSEKKLTLMDLVPVTAPVLTPEVESDMSKYLMGHHPGRPPADPGRFP